MNELFFERCPCYRLGLNKVLFLGIGTFTAQIMTNEPTHKQKTDPTPKAGRQQPTTTAKATQRQDALPKWNSDTKVVDMAWKNEVKYDAQLPKNAAPRQNDSPNRKSTVQNFSVTRTNCAAAKIDEKPSISTPNKTAAKNGAVGQAKQKVKPVLGFTSNRNEQIDTLKIVARMTTPK